MSGRGRSLFDPLPHLPYTPMASPFRKGNNS